MNKRQRCTERAAELIRLDEQGKAQNLNAVADALLKEFTLSEFTAWRYANDGATLRRKINKDSEIDKGGKNV